jgi:putative ABC transport system substrate-binding protein
MNRRAFVRAAVHGAWGVPLVALAQPAARLYRVAVLSPNARESQSSKAVYEEIRSALRDHGYVEGKNLVIDGRWAEGRTERLPALAAELAALKPDVVIAMTTQATLAAKRAAEATPIVMINVTDPVGVGLIASLAHPGGNVTGVTDFGYELSLKSVELAREIIPNVSRISVLVSDNPAHPFQLREIQSAARQLGMTVVPASAMAADELEKAIAFAKANASVLIVLGGGVQSGNRERIAVLAMSARLPTLAQVRSYVDVGCLASYGYKVLPQYRVAGRYVHQILKGAKAGDLPVEQPTNFELVINLKTAKSLSLSISQPLLARADDVIPS